MKKFVVAGIFLGGCILLLRIILPKLNQKSTTSLDVELIDYEPPKSVIRTGGGGTGYVQQEIRTPMEFGVQKGQYVNELNDPTWGNPYNNKQNVLTLRDPK